MTTCIKYQTFQFSFVETKNCCMIEYIDIHTDTRTSPVESGVPTVVWQANLQFFGFCIRQMSFSIQLFDTLCTKYISNYTVKTYCTEQISKRRISFEYGEAISSLKVISLHPNQYHNQFIFKKYVTYPLCISHSR